MWIMLNLIAFLRRKKTISQESIEEQRLRNYIKALRLMGRNQKIYSWFELGCALFLEEEVNVPFIRDLVICQEIEDHLGIPHLPLRGEYDFFPLPNFQALSQALGLSEGNKDITKVVEAFVEHANCKGVQV